eukprot:PhF_6_TR29288/c0_g1_i1/m.42923
MDESLFPMEMFISFPSPKINQLITTNLKGKPSRPVFRKCQITFEHNQTVLVVYRKKHDPKYYQLNKVERVCKRNISMNSAVSYELNVPIWGQIGLLLEFLSDKGTKELTLAARNVTQRDYLHEFFSKQVISVLENDLRKEDVEDETKAKTSVSQSPMREQRPVSPRAEALLTSMSFRTDSFRNRSALQFNIDEFTDKFLAGAEEVRRRYTSLEKPPDNGQVHMLYDSGYKLKTISADLTHPGFLNVSTTVGRVIKHEREKLDLRSVLIHADHVNKPDFFLTHRIDKANLLRINCRAKTVDLRNEWVKWLVFVKAKSGIQQTETETFSYLAVLSSTVGDAFRNVQNNVQSAPNERSPTLAAMCENLSFSQYESEPDPDDEKHEDALPVINLPRSTKDSDLNLRKIDSLFNPKINVKKGVWCFEKLFTSEEGSAIDGYSHHYARIWLSIEATELWIGQPKATTGSFVINDVVTFDAIQNVSDVPYDSLGMSINVSNPKRTIVLVMPCLEEKERILGLLTQNSVEVESDCINNNMNRRPVTTATDAATTSLTMKKGYTALTLCPVESGELQAVLSPKLSLAKDEMYSFADGDEAPLDTCAPKPLVEDIIGIGAHMCSLCGENKLLFDVCSRTGALHCFEVSDPRKGDSISKMDLIKQSKAALEKAFEILRYNED